MSLILTDKELDTTKLPKGSRVQRISYKQMESYDHNKEVEVIAGSRAMAIKANAMDLPGLRFFQLTSADFDGVPLEELRAKGVMVANAGSTYSAPIAETVVFGMLSMAKKLRRNPNNRHFKLQRHYTEITELLQKKVLILGAGNIGGAIAKRLAGFDMTIIGYDLFANDKLFFNQIINDRDALLSALAECDYMISTLPDNDATRGFINADLLSRMKNTAVIVNVGRKAVFNQDDLYSALKAKKLGGAVLDMFEKIPNPITNKFRRLRNVIVLPGVSAVSQEVNTRLK